MPVQLSHELVYFFLLKIYYILTIYVNIVTLFLKQDLVLRNVMLFVSVTVLEVSNLFISDTCLKTKPNIYSNTHNHTHFPCSSE